MVQIEVSENLLELDQALQNLPNRPGVFLLWAREGEPYLGRTTLLRRRLLRLLRERVQPGRLLNLRHTVARIEYWLTGSGLESSLRMYELARLHFRHKYLKLLNLRMPPYVKVVLNNPFPRTKVTHQLARSLALYYGPFRTRAGAERFEVGLLDLFQVRRCQENLIPSSQHPGCMYGEMGMCLRPCQEVVGIEEYRSEVNRVLEFLKSDGNSFTATVSAARDRFSEQMEFEEAARQHRLFEKIQEVVKSRDDLARDIDRLFGAAITPSADPGGVELWFVHQGCWQAPVRLTFAAVEGKTSSLDSKLRECFAGFKPQTVSARGKQEQLALLARWFYSSWRDGEWLSFDDYPEIPYRKLVRAISKVAARQAAQTSS